MLWEQQKTKRTKRRKRTTPAEYYVRICHQMTRAMLYFLTLDPETSPDIWGLTDFHYAAGRQ